MASSAYSNGQLAPITTMTTMPTNMISLEDHQFLMDQQREHYEQIIANLQKQLRHQNDKNADGMKQTNDGSNINRRHSSVFELDALIGSRAVEDHIDDDHSLFPKKRKQNSHKRGATSQLMAELLEFESGDEDDTDSSSSEDPQNKNGYDAIVLEQTLLEQQFQDTDTVDGLKEIVETLKAELANSRMSEYKMHHTQRRASISINRRTEGMREILKSKMDLVDSLSKEFERMRNIIKWQQTQIWWQQMQHQEMS